MPVTCHMARGTETDRKQLADHLALKEEGPMLTGWGQGHHWGLGWRRDRKLVFRDVIRQWVSSSC